MKIYIMFKKKNTTMLEKLIAKWTNGPYSHVEIMIPNNNIYYMYSAVNYKEYRGVRKQKGYFNRDVFDYKEIEITKEQYLIIYSFLESILGSKYDGAGILGFILPTQDRTDRWFCSEVVSNCFKIIGEEFMWLIEPSSVSPNRLGRMLHMIENNQPTYIERITHLFT